MELRRFVSLVRRHSRLLVASVLAATFVTYFLSGFLPRVYQSDAIINVGQGLSAVNPSSDQLTASRSLSLTYQQLATTRPILEAAIAKVGLAEDPAALATRVDARADANSTLFTITITDSDAGRAAATANAIANALVAVSPTIQGRQQQTQQFIDSELKTIQGEITAAQAEADALVAIPIRTAAQDLRLAALQTELIGLRQTYTTLLAYSTDPSANLLTIVQPAAVPSAQISPKPLFNAAVAAILSIIVVLVGIALLEQFADAVRTPEEASAVGGIPALGAIPRIPAAAGRNPIYALTTIMQPRALASEAFRILRANLEFSSPDEPLRTMLVASPNPGEGKTTIAANLAVAFSQAGRRTLLVDVDFRRPGLHEVFRLDNLMGVSSLLASRDLGVSDVARRSEDGNFWVVTTGPIPPNPAELAVSRRMTEVIALLREAADLVIFDGPPILAAADAASLARQLDGTIIVVQAGRTRRASLRAAMSALERVGARTLGTVVNRLPSWDAPTAYAYDRSDADGRGGSNVTAAESAPGVAAP